MPDRERTVRVLALCTAWYAISSTQNVINKKFLSAHSLPVTLSLVHMLSIALYLPIVIGILVVPASPVFSSMYYLRVLMPLSLGKLLASVTAHVSIWKVPVSYAHTVKALMPLFIVALTRCLLKEKHPLKIYLTLLPIVGGVVVATVTELSFDFAGMISAVCSTLFMALQTIYSKKVLEDTGIHQLRLLLILTRLTLLSLIPAWVYTDSSKFFTTVWSNEGYANSPLLVVLAISGLLNFSQNVIAFTMLSTVSSLSYSIASSMKRIVVICVSLLMLHNPVTPINMMGMTVAVTGVLVYNKVKSDLNQQRIELPRYSSDKLINGRLTAV
ncbi:solute carrier family 35 member E1-like [Corticium candelabrum]|uniref:solute carrier family 35 member E1-like n=1 Tax=Corticium candelabrum TaxID=121492 RepID=UPI002E26CA3D|nr:solute carrier family 35 member E1-like [Corticium candelabrum]